MSGGGFGGAEAADCGAGAGIGGADAGAVVRVGHAAEVAVACWWQSSATDCQCGPISWSLFRSNLWEILYATCSGGFCMPLANCHKMCSHKSPAGTSFKMAAFAGQLSVEFLSRFVYLICTLNSARPRSLLKTFRAQSFPETRIFPSLFRPPFKIRTTIKAKPQHQQ